jgi:Abnormal spindle-like microcephaly-assoc'd, ASPM-SPD-2-Hydin
MTDEPKSPGSFWKSLTGLITGIGGLVAAIGTVLAILAANGLPPFKPAAQVVLPIAVSPGNHGFGQVQQGKASEAFGVTVTNPRKGPVSLKVDIKGDNASSFQIALETCSAAPIAPSGTCDMEIVFSPQDAAALAARVVLSFPDDSVAAQVALTGTGLPAGALSFNPPSLNLGLYTSFKPVPANTTSQLTVTNTGAGRVTISTVKADDNHFTVGTSCFGKVLTPGTSCTMTVTFATGTDGTIKAKLQVIDDAPGSPHEMSLLGYRGPIILKPIPPQIQRIVPTLSP